MRTEIHKTDKLIQKFPFGTNLRNFSLLVCDPSHSVAFALGGGGRFSVRGSQERGPSQY
jgi:hypothetical protein